MITDPINANVRVFDAHTFRELHTIAIPRDSLVATAEVPGSPSPEGAATSRDSRWAFVTLQGETDSSRSTWSVERSSVMV